MTQYNVVIVRTGGGIHFARRIARSIKWMEENRIDITGGHTFNVDIVPVGRLGNYELPEGASPENTIIHARAAYPDPNGWMRHLIRLEQSGFTVINSTDTLLLTSNKLECAMRLFNSDIEHPITLEYNKSLPLDQRLDIVNESNLLGNTLIAKPYTSIEQGASVKLIDFGFNTELPEVMDLIESVPGNPIILQQYVPYTAIYRVIVIGGRAMPYSFVDRPTPEKWKVSVCLNKTSMEFVPNPNPDLLDLGERIQRFIGGEVNFIDIFETDPGEFVISEINTACNLRIHELLAKDAGHSRWNIHFNIARYLVRRTLERN